MGTSVYFGGGTLDRKVEVREPPTASLREVPSDTCELVSGRDTIVYLEGEV